MGLKELEIHQQIKRHHELPAVVQCEIRNSK